MRCPHCGLQSKWVAQCSCCGKKIAYGGNTEFYNKAFSTLTLKDIFSDVFQPHTKSQGERLFVVGTQTTTPHESDMLREWNKPWVFARVGMIGLVVYFIMYATAQYTAMMIPALIVTGAFVVPLTLLMFYWEMNIPRNIPLYEVIVVLLAGGALSLLFTVILGDLFVSDSAASATFYEEPAKLFALSIFMRKPEKKYILNGVLIGGAVGCGFAAMETAGYALVHMDIDLLLLRGLLAPGGHVVWAAIYGGALAYVKGSDKLEGKHFAHPVFLQYFTISVALHYMWNINIYFFSLPVVGDVKFILLIAIAWIFLLKIINLGIIQVLTLTDRIFPPMVNHIIAVNNKKMQAQLIGVTGEYSGNTILFDSKILTLGRDPNQCQLVFSNVAGVSRKHCSLWFDGQYVWITDAGSMSGTFLLNGSKIHPDAPVRLNSNTQFCLGSEKIIFKIIF